MAQTKKQIIKNIKRVVAEFGSFSVADASDGFGFTCPAISTTGSFVALAEVFHNNHVEVNVYDGNSTNCDSLEEYTVAYEDLSKEILEEIETIAYDYEAIQEKTEKRISN